VALPAQVARLRQHTRALLESQSIQRLCDACDEYSHPFFVNDHEHPYTFPAGKPFMWIRGRQVGGKTFCRARKSYRFSDDEFKPASRDGCGVDWPLGYKELEPYYDRESVAASYARRNRVGDGTSPRQPSPSGRG
jgi:choline dehydrogenase-like flavoprotein